MGHNAAAEIGDAFQLGIEVDLLFPAGNRLRGLLADPTHLKQLIAGSDAGSPGHHRKIIDTLKELEKAEKAWEFPNMNAVKVDAAKRIRLPVLRPGDYYEPEYSSPEEILLRRVPEPKRKGQMTKREALAAIEKSRLQFTVSWDELRLETRE